MADLNEAVRQLRKAPGFTATAVITLALGIGATTAIFTLVHQVMLKSLPVNKPEELWRVGDKIRCCNWGGYTQDNDGDFSLFSYEAYKNRGAFFQVGSGLGLGIPLAIAAGQLMTRQLFGVSPWDPRMLTIATLLLCAAALLASWIPAARAATVEPMVALRTE